MEYIKIVMEYVSKYAFVIMGALMVLVGIFGLVNLCYNPYRRQNKKMKICRRKILAYPNKISKQIEVLPEDYRRQWRAYERSGADRPSLVFEFIKKKHKLKLMWLYVAAAVLSLIFVAAFVMGDARYDYLIFQLVVWLTFAMFAIASKGAFGIRERKAKQIFGKFINELNRQTSLNNKDVSGVVERAVRSLNELNGREVTRSTLSRASEILRKKGLDTDRTADEQRKINTALNSLLQAYAKNAGLQTEKA